jgi:Zn ribbon nucleic-acid-binding protein
MDIKSNCPLCFEHELHVIKNRNDSNLMQCLSCGYATTDKFKIITSDLEENKEYKKLTQEMKEWSKVKNSRIWIPGMMTLPNCMIYPINSDDNLNMKWAVAWLVDIPVDEQKNYPDGNSGFYKQKYDNDNIKIFNKFSECIIELEKLVIEEKEKAKKFTKLTLPKLKKV